MRTKERFEDLGVGSDDLLLMTYKDRQRREIIHPWLDRRLNSTYSHWRLAATVERHMRMEDNKRFSSTMINPAHSELGTHSTGECIGRDENEGEWCQPKVSSV